MQVPMFLANLNSIFAKLYLIKKLMALEFITKLFQSKTKAFFDAFEKMADHLDKMGKKFSEFVNNNDELERGQLILQLQTLEAELREQSHQIFLDLGNNFITPFDREDIHALASCIEEVGDYICKSGKKINFYKVDTNDAGIKSFAAIIEQSTVTLKSAIVQLHNLKNMDNIANALMEINNLENDADDVYDQSIKHLFATEQDPKAVLKKCEIYQVLEIVTDMCEDASNVIESILVKHA
jgi:uncharacterized protein